MNRRSLPRYVGAPEACGCAGTIIIEMVCRRETGEIERHGGVESARSPGTEPCRGACARRWAVPKTLTRAFAGRAHDGRKASRKRRQIYPN